MIYFDQLAQQLNEGCGELNLYLMHVICDVSCATDVRKLFYRMHCH